MKRYISLLMVLPLLLGGFAITAAAVGSNDHQLIDYAPQYDYVSYFVDGYALATLGNEKNVIDGYNNRIFQSTDSNISYKNNYFRVSSGLNIEIYDTQNRLVHSFTGVASKGVIKNRISISEEVFSQRLYDLNGELLLSDSYNDIIYGNGDCVILDSGEDIFVFDLIGQKKIIEGIQKCVSVTDNYVVCVKNDLYGIVDFNGNILVDFLYSSIYNEISSEYFYCKTDSFLDIYNVRFEKAGTIDILSYKSYKALSEGLVCVEKSEGDYLFVDINGNAVIDHVSVGYQLINCQPFYDGLAVITTPNGCTYINKEGELATDKLWDGAFRFAYGYALVFNNEYDNDSDTNVKKWYIINEDFEIVRILDYDVYMDQYYSAATDFSDGSIRTIDPETGLMGFIFLENYQAISDRQLKLSPTSLYEIDRGNGTISNVAKDTSVGEFLKHFMNDSAVISVVDAEGNALDETDIVNDGYRVQLRSSVDSTVVLDELTIKIPMDSDVNDPEETTQNIPEKKPTFKVPNFKIGEMSDQLLYILIGSLTALVILIALGIVFGRKRH